MNSSRETPRSSAPLPLDKVPSRYSSSTISSRAAASTGRRRPSGAPRHPDPIRFAQEPSPYFTLQPAFEAVPLAAHDPPPILNLERSRTWIPIRPGRRFRTGPSISLSGVIDNQEWEELRRSPKGRPATDAGRRGQFHGSRRPPRRRINARCTSNSTTVGTAGMIKNTSAPAARAFSRSAARTYRDNTTIDVASSTRARTSRINVGPSIVLCANTMSVTTTSGTWVVSRRSASSGRVGWSVACPRSRSRSRYTPHPS
jgi:hypothetical protein